MLCGGGAHNTVLKTALRRLLPNLPIDSTNIHGFNPDFIEAMMFAWLADKALQRTPLDLGQSRVLEFPLFWVRFMRQARISLDKLNSIKVVMCFFNNL